MPKDFYAQLIKKKEPYIVAEIGANHNGDMKLAKKLIEEAKNCGADAVKFQSWSKSSLFCNMFYKEKSQFVDKRFGSLEQMVEKFSLTKEDHIKLKEYCDNKKITFCSTPFSFEEADLLQRLGVPYFKVASMDLNNHTFLEYIAKKGKPIILSTGMGTLGEIEEALRIIYKMGNSEVVLLHCIANYPPGDSTINLKNILTLQKIFGIPVGFSDHTIGTSIPLAAIALGAKIIEKHFTTDKSLPGWDHAVSADTAEIKILVNEGRRITKALGTYNRVISVAEMQQRDVFRRSIVAKDRIKKGHILSMNDVDFKRPGTGIRPDEVKYIIGRSLKRNIKKDELIHWEDFV